MLSPTAWVYLKNCYNNSRPVLFSACANEGMGNWLFGDVQTLCAKFVRHSTSSLYKFCPGISFDIYQQYYEVIRYDLKSVRKAVTPVQQIDSVNCKVWFCLASNASMTEKGSDEVLCSACKCLRSDLEWQQKRTLSESPDRKIKRQ